MKILLQGRHEELARQQAAARNVSVTKLMEGYILQDEYADRQNIMKNCIELMDCVNDLKERYDGLETILRLEKAGRELCRSLYTNREATGMRMP